MAVAEAVNNEAGLGSAASGIVTSGTATAAALRLAALRPLMFDAIVCRHAKINSTDALAYLRPATLSSRLLETSQESIR